MKPVAASLSVDTGRRDFLRTGFWGALTLSTVSFSAALTGCASAPPAAGLRVLRAGDLVVLRALMPVVLDGALPADESRAVVVNESIQLLDSLLAASSRAGQQQVNQLFDLLTFPPTRYTVVGLDKDWAEASPADISAFLASWSQSRFGLLRVGYTALTQMIAMNWYMQPRAWSTINNYIPPRVVG